MGKENQLIVYESEDGQIKLEIDLQDDSLWLNQEQMANLFATDRSGIAKHIKNIYLVQELKEEYTCAKITQTGSDGKVYQFIQYNLDMIKAVGYRVNSVVATHFRQ
jgi:hypothetical protein